MVSLLQSGSSAVTEAPLCKSYTNVILGGIQLKKATLYMCQDRYSSITASADASNTNTKAVTWEIAKKVFRFISCPER